eukprot:6310021-Prymnesium_polylepis.1
MTNIVDRANEPPPHGFFLYEPGTNYSNEAPRALPYDATAVAAGVASSASSAVTASSDVATPTRFSQMMQGTYVPPTIDIPGYAYGVWLASFLVFDCKVLATLSSVIYSDRPIFMLTPPARASSLPPTLILGLLVGAFLAGVTGIVVGVLTVYLCDFAAEMHVLLGELLGV